MDNLQETLMKRTRQHLHQAQVVGVADDGSVQVALGGALTKVGVAPSCLVCPAVGDRVLVMVSEAPTDGPLTSAAVLAVVARERPDATLRIRANGGLAIQAHTLQLGADESLQLHAPHTSIAAEDLTMASRAILTAADVLRVVAKSVTQVADRVSSSARLHHRSSTERDDIDAGALGVRCETVVDVRGEAVSMIGSRVVRMDGGQIQLG